MADTVARQAQFNTNTINPAMKQQSNSQANTSFTPASTSTSMTALTTESSSISCSVPHSINATSTGISAAASTPLIFMSSARVVATDKPITRLKTMNPGGRVPALGNVDISGSKDLNEDQKETIQHIRSESLAELNQLYIMKETIGQGAFGVVKICEHRATGKLYACKIVKKKDWKYSQLRTAAACEGGELVQTVRKRGMCTEDETRMIFVQLIDAVSYLHKHGVVHRDIKPENILLKSNHPSKLYNIKVADFGLACFADSMNRVENVAGTPMYMAHILNKVSTFDLIGKAPEIIHHLGYNHSCDIWSIGVMFYLLLSHYHKDAELLVQDMLKNGKIEYPDKLWGKINPSAKNLSELILRYDPAKRISAAEILRHPWTLNQSMESSQLNANVLDMMRSYNAEQRLRRGIITVVAALRFQKKNQAHLPTQDTRVQPYHHAVENKPRLAKPNGLILASPNALLTTSQRIINHGEYAANNSFGSNATAKLHGHTEFTSSHLIADSHAMSRSTKAPYMAPLSGSGSKDLATLETHNEMESSKKLNEPTVRPFYLKARQSHGSIMPVSGSSGTTPVVIGNSVAAMSRGTPVNHRGHEAGVRTEQNMTRETDSVGIGRSKKGCAKTFKDSNRDSPPEAKLKRAAVKPIGAIHEDDALIASGSKQLSNPFGSSIPAVSNMKVTLTHINTDLTSIERANPTISDIPPLPKIKPIFPSIHDQPTTSNNNDDRFNNHRAKR
ncbi:hypothetical protein BDEG_23153 [Batrachochytrium dendrobatidis JEL423]|uniref:Protein kinase domain-containing protein n=1 Tax=Batrachochytrium dendrobatidis (strain JEL423) TaxID=403673 RepID=A0A177WHL8_BATDL|nr:hypothetical protein BDEG_23153 [Batrachochytrium dendrobatidis JEL423]